MRTQSTILEVVRACLVRATLLLVFSMLAGLGFSDRMHAQSTAFTYQGRFAENGEPFSGQGEFQFTLWDAVSGGNQMAATDPEDIVIPVTNGLFAVSLDFGAAAFDGAGRWLEIKSRTSIGAFTTLTPRQPLTPTPYALRAFNLMTNGLAAGTYASAVTFNSAANSFTGTFAGNGAGLNDVNAATLDGLTGASLWKTGGNAGTAPGLHFLGTTDNQPLEIRVNGVRAMRFEDNGDSNDTDTLPDGAPNVIGGSPDNYVPAGVVGATIAGGGATNHFGSAFTNSVTADFGTVGGGYDNAANDSASTVGGGNNNAAEGSASTVVGGRGNTASGSNSTVGGGIANTSSGSDSTVGGGANNVASGRRATIGGGGASNLLFSNHASGEGSTVPGGTANVAGADYSFAAGYRAKAVHDGSFVWADWQESNFASSRPNEFAIRAGGGMRIANSGDGALLLTLETERSWGFRQLGTGANTALELYNFSLNKNFIINTDGRVGIGTTAPGFTLHVDGSAGKPGGGSWSTASDARLKDVGQTFTRGLDDLERIQPTHYRYSADNALELPNDRDYVGLIAQDVRAAIPEAIDANDSGYLHVNNDPILWTMLNGIKELNGKVKAGSRSLEEQLKRKDAEIEELKEQNARMLHRLEALEQRLK